jgi:acyl-[acyl-carrier-protein]-phospholipid O-acyltransferase/long-chain-fatty-acid--[acyl-carrier-protein] ligase
MKPDQADDRLKRSEYGPLIPLSPLPRTWRSLPHAFLHQARSQWSRVALADSLGSSLTFGQTLIRSIALSRVLGRLLGPEPYVGLLVPPSVNSAVANLAVAWLGKIAVNLNYTASQELVDSAIDQCGIKQVITSPRVLDRFKIRPKGNLVFLEDIPKQVSTLDKVASAVLARAVPTPFLGAFLPGLRSGQFNATATVIFTSGSTGDPKGVVLSHSNILQNIRQVQQHIHLLPDEVLLGTLPFFHSFGYTVTLWMALCLGKKVVYHFNPLDARIVGHLCEEHGVTLLASTPSYMRLYLQKCEPSQFKTLTHLLLGAEKLKPELFRDIKATLGIEPMEGYGTTELSPVVAANVPHDQVFPDGRHVHGNRPGTVGIPLPGTAIKTIDPDTGADLPVGTEGLIAVKGPQVMVGYLNRPEATAQVVKDGWYCTGDLGYVDPDGFLKITDRISRFSKVAGEMVPHVGVESAIMELTGVSEQQIAVTSVPDPRHGERLCVLYTDLGCSPQEVTQGLNARSIPKLWIPSPRDFVQVDAIPLTGTGKVDLRALRKLATAQLVAS